MTDRLPPHAIEATGYVGDGERFLADDGTWKVVATGAVSSGVILPEPAPMALTAFTSAEQKARFLISDDGGNSFAELPRSTRYADPDGSVAVRDGSLTRFAGRYLLAYTRAPASDPLGVSTTWGLAESEDLLTFTEIAVISPPAPTGIQTLWAPDLFVDGDRLYAYWSTRTTALGANHQTYVQYVTAADLTAWSTPALVSGLGPNVIDTTVVRDGSNYVAIFKDENTADLYKATSGSPIGPFIAEATRLPTGGMDNVEGPSLLRTPAGKWRLIYDAFEADELRYIESDDLTTWTTPTLLVIEAGMRHPGAIWLSHAELAGLRAQWNSVQSITPGTNVTVDDTDPRNPVVAAAAGTASAGELLVADGITAPPEFVWSDDGSDYLYEG